MRIGFLLISEDNPPLTFGCLVRANTIRKTKRFWQLIRGRNEIKSVITSGGRSCKPIRNALVKI